LTVEVRRYEPALQADWASVLGRARNGLFLFDRGYMEYHADRFPDFSAIAYVDGEAAVLLPATKAADSARVASHAGLTFGGFVLAKDLRSETAIAAVDAICEALKGWGAEGLTVKPVPLAFCEAPSQDAEYALFRRGFTLARRDLSSFVAASQPLLPSKSKRRDAAHAARLGVRIEETGIDRFFPLLSDVLRARHEAEPVHSREELGLLQGRFPDRIRAVGAFLDDRLAAGALVFRYDRVWHTQYLATGEEGRSSNALDLLILTLIDQAREAGVDGLSLGTSMQGDGLNAGLLWQKESFGARTILHDVLEGDL
jgi:hypothetical protein